MKDRRVVEADGTKSTNLKGRKKLNSIRPGGAVFARNKRFANGKSIEGYYNPALIKKQREFYKNANYLSKVKKKLKRHSVNLNHVDSSDVPPPQEEKKEILDVKGAQKRRQHRPYGLNQVYEKQREKTDKEKMEKAAIRTAQKQEREKAELRRKAEREKMLKKTKRGQPLMKYRLEHLLQTIEVTHQQ